MPVWPSLSTNTPDAIDDPTDRPSLAIDAIYDAVVAVQAIIAARGVAGGICDLGEDGLVPAGRIGTLQSYLSAALTALGGVEPAADTLPYFTGAATASRSALTAYARTLLAAIDATAARTTLGVLGLPEEIDTVITAAGLTPTTADDTQLLQSLGILAQRTNRVINSQFAVNQLHIDSYPAGTSGSVYVADQWRVQCVGGTFESSLIAFALGQTEVPGSPQNYLRVTNTSASGAANYCRISQPLEDVSILAGRTVTVSFWARASEVSYVSVVLRQYFGGGANSAPVDGIGATKLIIDTTWAQYDVTIAVDPINGKTSNSKSSSYTDLQIWVDAGTDFNAVTDTLGHRSITFDVTNIVCGIGHVAQTIDVRTDFSELSLARRYLEVGGGSQQNAGLAGGTLMGPQTVSFSLETYFQSVRYLNAKRTSPTVTLYNPLAANGAPRNITASEDCSGPWVPYSGVAGFVLAYTTSPNSAAGHLNAVNWLSDARFA